ncbi:MAG: alanine--tRNA ligase-related protein, partial [archaeon]
MKLEKLKEEIKKKASKEPEKYYPTKTLKEEGYRRQKCNNCGNYYWSTEKRETCDEPECIGGYQFINNPPANKKIGLIESWESFKKHMGKKGYTSIKRYPMVARWRKDLYWTNASILDFQPHVVSGEVEPPANPLIVPQICARFNDIDSVGISGRHNTSFIMTGQHAFKKPSEFQQEKYFKDYLTWFTKTLKIPKKDLVIHEDEWGGGGNLGVSMEIFSRGLELGNQVYMNYKIKENGKINYEPLDIQVLDMGMGQARIPWLLTGKNTIYQLQSPKAVKYLFKQTGLRETQTYKDFLPYSGIMNVDEIKNIEEGWEKIAKKINKDKKELKEEVTSIARLYSITDHIRTLLFAVTDGSLPSNTSGGHNLRTLYRRIHDFKEEQGWKIDLVKVAEKHAEYLKPIYPELKDNIEEIKNVLQNEEEKYNKTLKKTKKQIEKTLKKEEITIEEMIDLYDTKGISPETIKRKAREIGKKIKIPQNFYAKVAEKHLKEEDEIRKEEINVREINLSNYPKTQTLYHEGNLEFKGPYTFKAKVLGNERINGKNYVILNKTGFYPESGGQEPDHGEINGEKVKDVKKVEGKILHQTDKKIRKGKQVEGKIDEKRRKSLTKHHTATHII